MSIEISPETASYLSAEAQSQGISIDELLARLISERVTTGCPVPSGPELPLWRLGGRGAFHRRDIYEDVD